MASFVIFIAEKENKRMNRFWKYFLKPSNAIKLTEEIKFRFNATQTGKCQRNASFKRNIEMENLMKYRNGIRWNRQYGIWNRISASRLYSQPLSGRASEKRAVGEFLNSFFENAAFLNTLQQMHSNTLKCIIMYTNCTVFIQFHSPTLY